jgi:hypothetical protein
MDAIWNSVVSNIEFWKIFFTTFAFGAFGGTINYILLDDEIQNQVSGLAGIKKYRLIKSIIVGAGAAFIVPLFLQTISNGLLDKPLELKEYFVYAGFCLIASIFSRRFFDSVAEKALKIAQKANETAVIANRKAEDVEDAISEGGDDDDELTDADLEILEPEMRAKVINDVQKIKQAFQDSKYVYRTAKGIAKNMSIDENVVRMILEELEKKGFVRKVVNNKNSKILWTLSKFSK